MRTTRTFSIVGSLRQRHLLAQRAAMRKDSNRYLMLVDLAPVIKKLRDSDHLRLASLWTSPHEIIESLVEEPMVPRDAPLFMERLQEILEQSELITPELLGKDYFEQPNFDGDFFTELEIELEKLQLYIDVFLENFHRSVSQGNIVEYELVRWLGRTQALFALRIEGNKEYGRHSID